MCKMYRIKEFPLKIQVSCEKCSAKGYIAENCYSCNGKGIHNKTLLVYAVRPYEIVKIDRDSKTRELRYWEDESCYFDEDLHLIHFTIKDALAESKKRNIEKYGLEFVKQYL